MLNKMTIKLLLRHFFNTLAFINVSITKKFFFFSAGTLFWLVATSAVGFVMIFSLGAETAKLVDIITPEQKVLNSCVRKLGGANISMHKIAIAGSTEEINEYYHLGKTRLEDCRSFLITLLTGGQIKDYSRSSGELYDEFALVSIEDPAKRKVIEQAISSIRNAEGLLNEFVNSRERIGAMTSDLRGRLSECDTITQSTVGVLNKLSVGLSKEWGSVSDIIKDKFRVALLLISLTFIAGAMLSIIFGYLIAQNIVKPIRAIISRFKAFSARDLEFAREIEVISKDEIGELAEQYNRFLNAFKVVTSFKRVIEEDENVEDIYIRLGTIMTEEIGFHKCIIYEISTYNNTIKPVYPPGADTAALHCGADILLNSDLCRVKRTGHSVSSMEYDGICKYFKSKQENVYFCIPIIIAGQVGGVVQIIADTKDAASPELMRRLSKAREYISEAQPVLGTKTIMKAFKDFSIKDALTDLYNRRFLEETADNVVSGILRRATRLALLMCDLDFFKEVNDRYGHDVGDIVLKETAACIKRCVRSSDLVIRFGGEEFLVLLMDIENEYSMEIAEKIRITVEQNKIHTTGGFIQKTISIGISEFPMDTQGFWEAIKFADVALYKAKETGRNKAVRFTSDMWTEKRF